MLANKLLRLVVGIFIYLVILSLCYVLYIKFFEVNVVFYASVFSAVLATLVFGVVVYCAGLFCVFSDFEKIQQILMSVIIGYSVAISVPTVIDRSLSFYILEKLQQRGGGVNLDRFHYIFTEEYVREHKLVDIRLTEQEQSGTIRIDGNCVRLTDKGSSLASFSRFFRSHFLPRKRLLRGVYTDELIDPFSRSDKTPDYSC